MRARLSLLVVACALAGCSAGADTLSKDALPRLVLAPADLPRAFERFDEGRQVIFESPRGRRADPERFGRIGGWKARYRRPGSPTVEGPLVIDSRADLFDSADGAKDELDLIRAEHPDAPASDVVGDEGLLVATSQPGVPTPVRTYLLAWRSGDVVAVLTVNGFENRLRQADAVRLARSQQERIDSARG